MKRVFLIVLAVVLLMTGCTKTESNKKAKGYQITIGYGFSSYAMFSADQVVIINLLAQFNTLSFEKTTEEMDLGSAFNVNISRNEKSVKNFWVDKNGIFWINGEAQCYKVSSGSLNYEKLKAIYEASKNHKTGLALPDIKQENIANKSLNVTMQKEKSKNELLAMIDSMTKPTKEKPNLSLSSNPYDYINAHRDTFNRLLAGGQSTVAIFVDMLRNSKEFGLDKYIMAAVCAEITGIGNGGSKTWSTAYEWLKLYDKED